MAFDLHPILEEGEVPKPGLWYVVALDEDRDSTPKANIGCCSNYEQFGGGAKGGRILLSCGADPEGIFSELHQVVVGNGSLKWESIPGGEDCPSRYEHCSFLVKSEDHSVLYVFGGADLSGPLNDMWKFEEGQWSLVQQKGDVPPARTYHSTSCTMRGDSSLVVFGGGDFGTTPVADSKVYIFNSVNNEWSSPNTNNQPPSSRQGHVTVIVGDRLFVHGGMSGENIYSDLFVLDLVTWDWSSPPTTGIASPRLAAHGCSVIGKVIYMFGGINPSVKTSNALYSLDAETLEWNLIVTSGPPPPPRLDLAMCTVLLPIPHSQSLETGVESPVGDSTSESKMSKNSFKVSVEAQVMKDEGNDSTEASIPKTVTVIGPESIKGDDFAVSTQATVDMPLHPHIGSSTDANKCSGTTGESKTIVSGTEDSAEILASALDQSAPSPLLECGSQPDKDGSYKDGSARLATQTVPVLFVFGGMDNTGNVFADSYVIIPK